MFFCSRFRFSTQPFWRCTCVASCHVCSLRVAELCGDLLLWPRGQGSEDASKRPMSGPKPWPRNSRRQNGCRLRQKQAAGWQPRPGEGPSLVGGLMRAVQARPEEEEEEEEEEKEPEKAPEACLLQTFGHHCLSCSSSLGRGRRRISKPTSV